VKRTSCALVVLSLLAVGCGDPREPFIGTYRGTGGTSVRFPDGSTEYYPWGEITVIVTAPEGVSTLDLGGKCAMQGRVNSSTAFAIDPKSCPRELFEVGNGATCYSQMVVESGYGVLTGGTLSVRYSGKFNITGCSDGAASFTTQDTGEMTVTRL
jgi:hypothetical protein